MNCLGILNFILPLLFIKINSETIFKDFPKEECLPFLSYVNSTSVINNIIFEEGENYILGINENGVVDVCASNLIRNSLHPYPFYCDGKIILDNLTISSAKPYIVCSFNSLTCSSNKKTYLNKEVSVSLVKCNLLNSVIKESDGTLLSRGIVNEEIMKDCRCSNITTDHKMNDKSFLFTEIFYCSVLSGFMENCEDNFYGRIVSGITDKTRCSFICINSTFSKCFRENPEYYDRKVKTCHELEDSEIKRKNENNLFVNGKRNKYFNEEETDVFENEVYNDRAILSLDHNYSFIYCNFSECNSLEDGGAIFVRQENEKDKYELSLEYCIFVNCSSSDHNGGAVYASSLATFLVTGCNFVNCSTTNNIGYGGAIYAHNVNKCGYVHDSAFFGCSSVNDSGGLHLDSILSSSSPCVEIRDSGSVQGCYFYSCEAKQQGGAMELNFIEKGTVYNCYFGHCTSEQNGGALSISSLSEKLLCFVLFDKNNAKKGLDVYSESYKEYDPFFFCYSNSGEGRVIFLSLNRDQYLPSYSYRIVSSLSSEDDAGCGIDDSHPCSSVRYALSLISEDLKFISLEGNSQERIQFSIINYEFIVMGKNIEESQLEICSDYNEDVSNGAVFMINEGSISFYYFSLVLSKNSLQNPIFSLSNENDALNITECSFSLSSPFSFTSSFLSSSLGKVIIESVSFENIELTDHCLFSYVNTSPSLKYKHTSNDDIKYSLSFVNSSFDGIISKHGNGGCVEARLIDGCQVIANYSKFMNCGTQEGIGGVFYYEQLEDTNKLLFFKDTFSNNIAQKGFNVYFKVKSDISFYISPNNWIGTITTTDGDGNLFWVEYNDGINRLDKSLFFFFTPPSSDPDLTAVYIGGDMADINSDTCGWIDLQCNSLDTALLNAKEIIKEIILYGDTNLHSSQDLSDKTVKSKDDTLNTIEFDYSLKYEKKTILKNTQNLFLNSLIFSFPPLFDKQYNSLYLISSNSFLSVSHSQFICSDTSSDINLYLLFIENGTVSLKDVCFSSLSFQSKCCPVEIEASAMTYVLNFTEVKAETVILNDFPFLYTNKTIRPFSVKINEDNDELYTLQLFDCEFSDIQRNKGNGCILETEFKERQNISIINTKFNRCSVNVEDGKGGALWLLLNKSNEISLSGTTFEDCKASEGNNIFIASEYLDATVNILAKELVITSDTLTKEASGYYLDNPSLIIPFVYFIETFVEIYVDINGRDLDYCGLKDFECKSLKKSLERSSEGDKTIHISDGTENYGVNELKEGEFNIESLEEESKLIISDNCSFITSVPSIFKGFDFILPEKLTISSSKSSFNNMVSNNFSYSTNSKDNQWIKSSSEEIHSLFLTNSASLEIINCSFAVMGESFDYSIWMVNGGRLDLNNISFESQSLISIHSPLTVINEGGNGRFDFVYFRNFSTVDENNGSVIHAIIGDGNELKMNNCIFTKCNSNNGLGGAVYVDVSESSILEIKDCSFNENEGNIGNNIYIFNSKGIFLPNKSNFEGTVYLTYDEEKDKRFWMSVEDIEISAPLFHFLYNPIQISDSLQLFVGGESGGIDSDGCGWEDVPCCSIEKAIKQSSKLKNIIINIPKDCFINGYESISVNQNIGIESKGSEQTKFNIDDNFNDISSVAIFNILNNIFSISHLSFILKKMIIKIPLFSLSQNESSLKLKDTSLIQEERCSVTSALFSISSGDVLLDSFRCSNIVISNSSLLSFSFSLNDDKYSNNEYNLFVNISGCSFENVKRSDGNGGVIEAELCNSDTLIISNSNFSKSYASYGDGGGIFLNVVDEISSFSLTGCSFKENKANKGNNVYISLESNNLKILNLDGWKEYLDADTSDDNNFWVDYDDNYFKLSLPLKHFVISPLTDSETNSLFVGGSNQGLDVNGCGWEDVPCSTLQKAINILSGKTDSSVYFTKGSNVDALSCIIVENTLKVEGKGKASSIYVIDNEFDDSLSLSAFSIETGSLTFNNLCFYLKKKELKIPLFYLSKSNGNLNISNFLIVQSNGCTILSGLWKISLGKAVLNDVECTNLVTSKNAVIYIESESSSSVPSSSSVVNDEDNLLNVNISDCLFENLTRINGNGSCLEVFLCKHDSLNIHSTSFVNDHCSSGYGGALWIKLDEKNQLSLSGSSFNSCYASVGNNIYIESSIREDVIDFLCSEENPALKREEIEGKESRSSSSDSDIDNTYYWVIALVGSIIIVAFCIVIIIIVCIFEKKLKRKEEQ